MLKGALDPLRGSVIAFALPIGDLSLSRPQATILETRRQGGPQSLLTLRRPETVGCAHASLGSEGKEDLKSLLALRSPEKEGSRRKTKAERQKAV